MHAEVHEGIGSEVASPSTLGALRRDHSQAQTRYRLAGCPNVMTCSAGGRCRGGRTRRAARSPAAPGRLLHHRGRGMDQLVPVRPTAPTERRFIAERDSMKYRNVRRTHRGTLFVATTVGMERRYVTVESVDIEERIAVGPRGPGSPLRADQAILNNEATRPIRSRSCSAPSTGSPGLTRTTGAGSSPRRKATHTGSATRTLAGAGSLRNTTTLPSRGFVPAMGHHDHNTLSPGPGPGSSRRRRRCGCRPSDHPDLQMITAEESVMRTDAWVWPLWTTISPPIPSGRDDRPRRQIA